MGDGWGPALMDTQEEYDFIRHVADHDPFLGGNDVQGYFLEGTSVQPGDIAINYTDYRPIQPTGNL